MYTDFHAWEINVSTMLLSNPNNRSHICHALSFQKHSLIICSSERSERALRTIVYLISFLRNCNSMHLHFILPHGNINDSLTDKLLSKDQYWENILSASEQSERAWNFFAFISIKSPISFNVWVGILTNNMTFLGYFVTSVHSMHITHNVAL